MRKKNLEMSFDSGRVMWMSIIIIQNQDILFLTKASHYNSKCEEMKEYKQFTCLHSINDDSLGKFKSAESLK